MPDELVLPASLVAAIVLFALGTGVGMLLVMAADGHRRAPGRIVRDEVGADGEWRPGADRGAAARDAHGRPGAPTG